MFSRLRAVVFVVLAALVLTLGASAGAVGDAAGFEDDDANLADDVGNTLIDWNSFAPVTWTGTAPYRQAEKSALGWLFRGIEDDGDSTSDTAFAGGTKQDDDCATVDPQKAPNKDDLERIYLATKTGSNGHTYLVLAWMRIPQNTTSPSAHIGFEFNQGTAGACGGSSGTLAKRVAGDLLVVYDFEGGSGDEPVITLREWITSGTCEVASKSPPCWGEATDLTDIGFAEAAVNVGETVEDAIAPTPDTLGLSEFGEAGIDLNDAGVFGEGSCATFGTAYAVSRSSGNSGTAQMKDLVGPADFTLTNCDATLETTPSDDAVAIGEPVTDLATVVGSKEGGDAPTPTGDVTFFLCGPTAPDATELCTSGGDQVGSPEALSGSGDTATATSDAVNTPEDPLDAGRYCFRAVYEGDENYPELTHVGLGNSECFVVQKASPTVTTDAGDGFELGSGTLSDTATLTGGVDPTGSITFSLYGPGDETCSAAAIFTDTQPVSGNGSYTSESFTPTAAGTYRWIANYSGDANNAATANECNEANENVVVTSQPPPPPPPPPVIDLAILKADNPDPVELGGNLTYTLTVTNNGPDTATGVVVADQLPASTTFVSVATTQGSCSQAAGVVTCTLGTLAPAATVTITVVVTPTATGTIVNTATVAGNEGDSNPANNTATEPTVVQGPFTPPAVCSSLTVGPRQLQVGKRSTIVARVRLSNNRPFVNARVRVTGPRINVTKRTNGQGIARFTVRPTRAGIVRITVLGSPQCSVRRVGILGAIKPPPLTG